MEERSGILLLGNKSSKHKIQMNYGVLVFPKHFKDKWFVVFSSPGDFTTAYTTEFVVFKEKYEEFERLNCNLIWLSIDEVFSCIKWIEWIKDNLNIQIEFPIIAYTGKVANGLGFIHPGKGTNTVGAVFIVDDKAKIRIILYYYQELGRNIDGIVKGIGVMQVFYKYNVAMPAD